ncbi:MAG: outer membrane beta-barrel protein [Alistipes indistinctus]
MLPSNLGADKIHINDQSERSDNYKANNHLEAAYAAFNIPLGKFNIYAGARLELFRTAVTTYGNVSDKKRTYDYTEPASVAQRHLQLQPQIAAAHRLRYDGQPPEFRELSPSTYEDFDMYSLVMATPT